MAVIVKTMLVAFLLNDYTAREKRLITFLQKVRDSIFVNVINYKGLPLSLSKRPFLTDVKRSFIQSHNKSTMNDIRTIVAEASTRVTQTVQKRQMASGAAAPEWAGIDKDIGDRIPEASKVSTF